MRKIENKDSGSETKNILKLKNIIFIAFKAETPDIRLGGLAERSEALLLREKINENQKESRFAPGPSNL